MISQSDELEEEDGSTSIVIRRRALPFAPALFVVEMELVRVGAASESEDEERVKVLRDVRPFLRRGFGSADETTARTGGEESSPSESETGFTAALGGEGGKSSSASVWGRGRGSSSFARACADRWVAIGRRRAARRC